MDPGQKTQTKCARGLYLKETHYFFVFMLEQNNITKQFIEHLQALLDKGIIKNHAEVIEKIGWNKTSMSNVINGRMNIPHYVYVKFKETFDVSEPTPIPSLPPEVYKEKYFALLEAQANQSILLVNELKEIKELLKNISDRL